MVLQREPNLARSPATVEPRRERTTAARKSGDGTAKSRRGASNTHWRAGELEAVLEAVTDALIVYDTAGRIVRMNSATRTLLGLDAVPEYEGLALDERLERVQMRDRDGVPLPRERWPHSHFLHGDALGGEAAPDIRVRALDGRELELSVSGAPIRDERGRTTGAVAVFRDVTARRQSERQTQQALLTLIASLGEANAHMDEFLTMVGHELRNPLSGIRASIQLAERRLRKMAEEAGPLSEAIARVVDPLQNGERQTKLLDRLVEDLLDVSRIQTDRLELRSVPVDLAALVRQAVEQQRVSHPGRRIALVGQDDTEVLMHADPDRIIQVVTNYLTNALKYSPEHTPVQVGLTVEPAVARVTVRDEGPGISVEQQARIWERFHRAPSAEEGEKTGLGLGLYISRKLVERHGGTVGVESAPGQGSTFWFVLPLASA
jgi:signal transduction histidine kinase